LALFSWFPNITERPAWLLCRHQAERDSPWILWSAVV